MDDLWLHSGRRRRERGRRRRPGARRWVLAGAALAALMAVAGVAVAAAVALSQWHAIVTGCTLDGLRPAVTLGADSYVYASDGTYLGAVPSDVHRQPVQLDAMSPWLVRATTAIEDRRFWEHGGVDVKGTLRAALADLRARKPVQGGSTLDQQLVDALYLPNRPHTLDFKKREACLAMKLDSAWGKERVLRRYLNTVYYGNHAYGVEAAARTYFSRHAKALGPAQAALLAGLPQAPSRFDPFRRPGAAKARRDRVLDAMAATGVLTAARAAALKTLPLNLRPSPMWDIERAPAFFQYVRKELVGAYGEQRVRRGGLRVTTTVVPRFQRLARKAIDGTLDRPGDPAAALVSVDPASGAIVAMVSRVRGHRLDFNLAVQGRNEAGSTFKPFVLAAAVEQGMNPYGTRYLSAPFSYRTGNGDEVWKVHTYSRTYAGVETVARALIHSDNTVFARLTVDVGPGRVARMARRLGVRSPLLHVPSIGLGVNDVSVLDMASAYATLAALGVHRQPFAIRKVVLRDGTVDPRWHRAEPKRVVSRGVARTVDQVLRTNVRRGTGTAAQLDREVAGKTGTTERFTDAWFVGFTRRLATAVWIGYPHRNTPMTDVHGIRVTGGSLPAAIWHDFMQPAVRYWKPKRFPPAGGVEFRPWRGAHAYLPGKAQAGLP